MAKRPTIADLAKHAGVGVATVDRVLNGRAPVRPETAKRVYEAANAIGYHAAGLIRQRLRPDLPRYRLGFVLQKPRQFFYQQFAREIEHAVARATTFSAAPRIEFTQSQTPNDLADTLRSVGATTQAVAMAGPDHPALTEVVQELKDRGVPVFSLFSDFAPGVREGYIGLNNRKVGRSAAWVIARTAQNPGKVAIFVGSHRFHGHELREIGFRTYFREHAPHFRLLDTMVNLETRQLTHEATLDLMQRHPDLTGLYIAGGGMEGAISALREDGAGTPITAVCHEITPESRAALADHLVTTVFATPLPQLATDLIGLMVRAIDTGAADAPGQTFLPFDILISENI